VKEPRSLLFGLLAIVVVAYLISQGTAGRSEYLFVYANPRVPAAHQAQANVQHTPRHQHPITRISQLDPAQYATTGQYQTWAYSACSAAAMTEVINAYGHHYRIADILAVEATLGEITPESGLLEDAGIKHTVARFGFQTRWGYSLSLDQIVALANHDTPVIVAFPPARYPGGHLLVVTGGTHSIVYLADSSLFNRHWLGRAQFLAWWEGFSAVVTPR